MVVTSPCSFWSITSRTRGLIPQASPTFATMVEAVSSAAPTYAWVQFAVAARLGVDIVNFLRHGDPSAPLVQLAPLSCRKVWIWAAVIDVES